MQAAAHAQLKEIMSWVSEEPEHIIDLMTQDEIDKILKLGYLPQNIWDDMKTRITAASKR